MIQNHRISRSRWPETVLATGFIAGLLVCMLAPTADAAPRIASRDTGYNGSYASQPTRQQVFAMVIDEALKQNFSPALALAVAKTESDFQADAESHAGARGVMQIMPRTGRTELGLQPNDLWDARTNIRGGIRFLKQLIKAYQGRVDIALSHYNGGSRVRRPDGSLRIIPATRGYVKKVQRLERRFAQNKKVMLASLKQQKRRPAVSTARNKDVTTVYGSRDKSRALQARTRHLANGLDRLDQQLGRIDRLLKQGPVRANPWRSSMDTDW